MRNKLFVLCLCCLASSTLFAADYQGSLDWSTRAELGTLVSGVEGAAGKGLALRLHMAGAPNLR